MVTKLIRRKMCFKKAFKILKDNIYKLAQAMNNTI